MHKETVEKLREQEVVRYMQPLREGGSLPALVEADDTYKYVLKFKGAGHGVKALIAELIGGKIALALGLPIPELVFLDLDEAFGRTEADEEIQDLLRGSHGRNLGLHFLSQALTFDPAVTEVEALLASKIVWLDAFITNVDRTGKNTNMLLWKKELWLIDHGACLYFHHSFTNWEKAAVTPFALIKDHVLLKQAAKLDDIDRFFREILNDTILKNIVTLIPEEWLQWEDSDHSSDEIREIYFKFLSTRLSNSEIFLNEAKNAREKLI